MTNVGLVLSFLLYSIWVFVLRISPFLVLVWYGYLMMFVFFNPFVRSIYHAKTFMYLGKITIVLICYKTISGYTHQISYLTDITIWYPWVGSLIPN